MAYTDSDQEAQSRPATPKKVLGAPFVVHCPFCGSSETRQVAAFGTTHAYSQYFCQACRTPFEWIKWDDKAPVHDLPEFLQSKA